MAQDQMGLGHCKTEGLGICVAFTAIPLSLMSGCSVDQWLAVSLASPLHLDALEPGTLLCRYFVTLSGTGVVFSEESTPKH